MDIVEQGIVDHDLKPLAVAKVIASRRQTELKEVLKESDKLDKSLKLLEIKVDGWKY